MARGWVVRVSNPRIAPRHRPGCPHPRVVKGRDKPLLPELGMEVSFSVGDNVGTMVVEGKLG